MVEVTRDAWSVGIIFRHDVMSIRVAHVWSLEKARAPGEE